MDAAFVLVQCFLAVANSANHFKFGSIAKLTDSNTFSQKFLSRDKSKLSHHRNLKKVNSNNIRNQYIKDQISIHNERDEK